MIAFICPHCKQAAEANERVIGGATICPKCGQRLQLPGGPPPRPGSAEIPDEDEATLRAEVPDAFFPAAEKLGMPRYGVERWLHTGYDDKGWLLVVALLAFALFCFCVMRIFDYFFHRAENFAPNAGFPWINVFMGFFVSLPAGLACCYFAWKGIVKGMRLKKSYVLVWTGGFVHYDGLNYRPWRWADIASLNMQNVLQRTLWMVFELSRSQTKYYSVRLRDGTEYSFESILGPRAAQFGYQVEEETFRVMMPIAVARLEAGQPVRFDPFEMRPTGLVYRGRLTPWADLGSVRFERGSLRLDGMATNRGKVTVLLQKIDNHHVFLRLLEEKVGFEDED